MEKHKVAFLLSHPIQYFSPLFKKMTQHAGFDLVVFYCSDEGAKEMDDIGFGRKIKWDIPLVEGYNYKFLKNYSYFKTIFKPPFGLINPGIIKEILKDKYDAVIIYGWHHATHWLAYAAALLRRTPIYIRATQPLKQELSKPRWKIFIKKIILKFLFKNSAGLLACGSENRAFYEFYGAKRNKTVSMPYAVDNDRLIQAYRNLIKDKEGIKKSMGISPGKKVILFCGKFIYKKNPSDLLKAYEIMKAKDSAIVFIGDGKLRKDLEDYSKRSGIEDAFFVGFKNQTELPRYYIAGDVLVLPSHSETWGLVVNEAMCFHLPVIVSDSVGCSADLVKDGENGFIFKTGRIDELAACLDRIIEDPALQRSMGEKSFQIIKEWNYESDINSIFKGILSNTRKDG